MSRKRIARATVVAALSAACGGGGDGGTPPVTVAGVTITAPGAPPTFGALGRTVQFSAVAKDAGGASIAGASISWNSASTGVATVNGSGVVTAVANGTTTVTASSGGQTSPGVTVTVAQVPFALVVTPNPVTFGALGSSRQLLPVVRDSGGAPVPGFVVSFTLIPHGPPFGPTVTVSPTGLVTAIKNTTPGIADSIIANATGVQATLIANVNQTVQTIAIATPAGDSVLRTTTRTRQFTATATDSNNNVLVTQPTFAWTSSQSGVASVSSTGLVTAAGDGTTNIQAGAGGRSGTRVQLVQRVAQTMSIAPPTASISTSAGTQVFTGTAQDSNGTNLPIAWVSRDASVVSLNPATGPSTTATAVLNGTTRVVMVSGTRSDSASVTTSNQAAVSFTATIQPILTNSCAKANCHTGAVPTGSLNLSAGQAFGNLVNVNSIAAPALKRVNPGNPDDSFIIIKLEGTDPRMAGGRMPDDGATVGFLPQGTVNIIRAWIAQGALPNQRN